MLNRRLFLFAAPAIVVAPSLMRVSAKEQLVMWEYVTGIGKLEYANVPYDMHIPGHRGGLILATPSEIKKYTSNWNLDVEYHRAIRA